MFCRPVRDEEIGQTVEPSLDLSRLATTIARHRRANSPWKVRPSSVHFRGSFHQCRAQSLSR